MAIITGEKLALLLRRAVDSAESRLWIASPYIGPWADNVRRILGSAWQGRVTDVRLLTDIGAKGYRLSTLRWFFRKGKVRTLRGLHAKVYVADEIALLTSANLTGTAFSKRYEVGVTLSGKSATEAQAVVEKMWQLAEPLREEDVEEPSGANVPRDMDVDEGLRTLNELPPDPPDGPLPSDVFGDYDVFLRDYADLRALYVERQRLWSEVPIYFEMDAFLNYLYFDAPRQPTNAYDTLPPRRLTLKNRRAAVRKYAALFAKDYKNGNLNKSTRRWRTDRAREVRALLDLNRKHGLSVPKVEKLLWNLNCMSSYPVNIAKVINPKNNAIGEIRGTLRALIDETVPLERRMSDCSRRVFGLSKSSVQELIGFYYNGKYPLRNKNTNCGLRFFGYDVRVR